MGIADEIKKDLLEFNATFPLDRQYREKYGIGLFSSQHMALNPLNIYREFLEGVLYEEAQKEIEDSREREKQFKAGNLFRDIPRSKEEDEKLWNNLKANFGKLS